MKVGDLVRMKTHETGLVGIVVDRDYRRSSIQVGIKWFGGSGKMDWEPESWLEVVSEAG
jgi:hypothetical protein|tara:strand:- start:924 stop:1100 length:177 start_codon:yes stop_codon:yes gene_type:complete